MKHIICFSLLLILMISCNDESENSNQNSTRPIDTWVFRSVIDQNPRMITAALSKDLYVSYFTETGSIYKAWKGIVNLDGAVFNGVHGPQPTSIGDAYMVQAKDFQTWTIYQNGKPLTYQYNYLGHRFTNGHLELMHSFQIFESKEVIKVFEQVEAINSERNQLQFSRTFKVENVNKDQKITFSGKVAAIDKSVFKTNGELNFDDNSERILYDKKEFFEFKFNLKLNDKTTNLTVPVSTAVYKDLNLDDGFGEDYDSLPEGAQLIARNDCKTCHNKTIKTVGPSYISIAKKYEHSEENTLMLVDKIKLGGSGLWGEQAMTPHPEVSNYDLKTMTEYIFSLDTFEGEKAKSLTQNIQAIEAIEIDETELIPGTLTRIYNLKPGAKKVPDFSQRKPIQAGIIPNFDNLSDNDFVDLGEDFALLSIGYLYIPKDGIYDFRLWSDDGSVMYLHDKLIIDHDGNHSTSMKQSQLNLKEGYHPFRIEYFQGVLGKFLSWNYKPISEDTWKVIPSNLIFHNKNDQKLIGDLTLAMSIITNIPGDKMALEGVHPSFDLSQARPENFNKKIGGMDFLSDGRMVVSVWDTEGGVYIIDNAQSGNPETMTAKRIAFGLAEPLGLKVVDDRIFVMQKQEITELVDLDNDDVIDEYKTLCDDWGVSANFHEFGFGLAEKDGFLYANLSTGIMPGGAGMVAQHKNRGNCIKVSIADGSIEFVASGLRTPNGIGLGFENELFIADNQGDWLPSSKIIHVTPGAWFGSRAVDFEGTETLKEKKPVVWLPQDEIGNSPSTPSYLNIGPYKNQMIHGEVTHGGVKRVFVERVNDELQGCVFRFIQGLEAGVNRLVWGPDGALYTGGIGNPGNWQHAGTSWEGLQRLMYNDKPTFEMLSVSARTDGIEIEFTEPLQEGDGWNVEDYEVRQWYYLPTENYGGPKLDDKSLKIISVHVSDDRKKVFLELEGMQEDHVIYVHLENHFISENENSLWSTEAWYTLNQIPKDKQGFRVTTNYLNSNNTLSEKEKKDGWQLLFDGKSLQNFHTFKSDKIDSRWSIVNESIQYNPLTSGNGGDLVTNQEYENFELRLEWKISNCGNSGIFFNVVEKEEYCCTWLTGPEMQILDDSCHPDSRYATHRAGDLYDMLECKYATVNSAGEWNKVRLISDHGRVNFWLNGYKVVDFQMHDENWNKMIANSKFKDMKDFGKSKSGHIAVQDHGDKVWFRNIKIKLLATK